jgi:ABC-type amino acid transport substrate-binding protein
VNNGSKETASVTLRLFDGTLSLPVLVYGPFFEEFFGVEMNEFLQREELQKQVHEQLLAAKNNQTIIDFYCQSFFASVNEPENNPKKNNKKK